MLIALEGIDFVGKSTQISNLKEIYKDAIFTKEPGGIDKFGKTIREILLNSKLDNITELFLFLSDRSNHYANLINQSSNLIISDRSFISGIAYGMENFKNSDLINFDTLTLLNKIATKDNFDIKVVLLEISKSSLIQRMSSIKLDSIEERGIEYLLAVQSNLKETLIKLDINHIIINADENKDIITEKIKEFIDV